MLTDFNSDSTADDSDADPSWQLNINPSQKTGITY